MHGERTGACACVCARICVYLSTCFGTLMRTLTRSLHPELSSARVSAPASAKRRAERHLERRCSRRPTAVREIDKTCACCACCVIETLVSRGNAPSSSHFPAPLLQLPILIQFHAHTHTPPHSPTSTLVRWIVGWRTSILLITAFHSFLRRFRHCPAFTPSTLPEIRLQTLL